MFVHPAHSSLRQYPDVPSDADDAEAPWERGEGRRAGLEGAAMALVALCHADAALGGRVLDRRVLRSLGDFLVEMQVRLQRECTVGTWVGAIVGRWGGEMQVRLRGEGRGVST